MEQWTMEGLNADYGVNLGLMIVEGDTRTVTPMDYIVLKMGDEVRLPKDEAEAFLGQFYGFVEVHNFMLKWHWEEDVRDVNADRTSK